MTRSVVTVLMPVYNGEAYLGEAVESVLNQTREDFLLRIINDGSTDRTGTILESYADRRIQVLNNGARLGVAESLARGMEGLSSGYVARMDADDVCLPGRLERQASFLDENPEYAAVHSAVYLIGENGEPLGRSGCNYSDAVLIRWQLAWRNIVFHPTVMLRLAALNRHGLAYDSHYEGAEDFRLWSQLARKEAFGYVSEPLLSYRVHKKSVTRDNTADKTSHVLGRIIQEHVSGYGLELDGATAREIAIISASAKLDPATYRYQTLTWRLHKLARSAYEGFLKRETAANRKMVGRDLGGLLLKWARYMRATSSPYSLRLFLESIRYAPGAMFTRDGLALYAAHLLPVRWRRTIQYWFSGVRRGGAVG